MQEKTEQKKPTIVVIGAGAAGFSAALELADKGYQVALLEKNTLGSGASGQNPGRMGHGFHYTDVETAKAYLRASILVQKKHPGYLVGQELPFASPLRHGRYFITKDSNPDKQTILETYEAIREEYKRLIAEDSSNKVFGPAETFFRILDPSEYQDTVNMAIVDIGVETAEHLFNWQKFANDIRQKIMAHPNISLREHTEVTDITRNKPGQLRFTLLAKTDTNETISFETDYIINSTWQEIKRLNEKIGLTMVPGERTNRLKTLLVLKLPQSLENIHSMFFCMGQHCMISNLGNRRAMATFARTTNLEASSDLTLSENAQRLINGGATDEEKEYLASQMITGISHYIPEFANAEPIDVQFGIVQTQGNLSLSDLTNPSHPFNTRDDHCIRTEQIGVISNPCMKLFYFVENGQIVAEMIAQHQTATLVIHQCMKLIQERTTKEQIKFDVTIQRVVQEQLERLEPSMLKEEHIERIVNTLVVNLKAKVSAFSFLAQSTESQKEQSELQPGSNTL